MKILKTKDVLKMYDTVSFLCDKKPILIGSGVFVITGIIYGLDINPCITIDVVVEDIEPMLADLKLKTTASLHPITGSRFFDLEGFKLPIHIYQMSTISEVLNEPHLGYDRLALSDDGSSYVYVLKKDQLIKLYQDRGLKSDIIKANALKAVDKFDPIKRMIIDRDNGKVNDLFSNR